MWAEPQENGKVKFVERYTHPITEKLKKVSVTMDKDTRTTRKQAEQILSVRIEEKKKQLSAGKDTNYTIRDLVDAYRSYQQQRCSNRGKQSGGYKDSTLRRNYFTSEKALKLLGEDALLDNITAQYIRDKMLDTGEPNSTINEQLKRTKSILRWGYKHDMVKDVSFLDKVEPLPDATYRSKIEDKFLETDEFLKLVDNLKVKRWKLLTLFIGLSGVRVGEAVALPDANVRFPDRSIHIENTYDSNNKETTSAKTSSSIRDLYMQDELYNVCREIKLFMMQQGLMNGYGKSPLFFQWDDGGHISYYAYNKYLKENGKLILGRDDVTPHILRHTHTCMLAENGVSLDTITRRLGHSDSKVTRDIYLHVTKRIKQNDSLQIARVSVL